MTFWQTKAICALFFLNYIPFFLLVVYFSYTMLK